MRRFSYFTRRSVSASAAILVLAILFSSTVFAQTTAFTYQGRLNDASATAASGSYDFQFALYDAATAGTQIGTTRTLSSVTVANGVFTVELDFGAAAFNGAARYLEITVKKTTDGSFTTLAPRQPITSTPYAIRSLNASNVETSTAGNSVVNSINNAATNTTINSNRLAADVVRLKPPASQTSTTTAADTALLDLTGTIVDQNGNATAAARLRFNHDGAFGIYKNPNTSNPYASPILKLNADSSLLIPGSFTGDFDGASVPTEGAGTRMMWYPGKAAFRAGIINGTQWDAANIGSYSTAFGQNVRASGDYGFAAGKATTAAQVGSVAIGEGNTASGANSVALGYGAHTNARQGTFVFADRTGPLVYDSSGNLDSTASDTFRAAVNHSANWRVSGGFRIFTSSNLSTGVTIQNGSTTSNWCNQTNAVISTSTCAYLSTSGVWTDNSSVHLKTNFAPLNARLILGKVLKLPIQSWSYKVDPPNVRHIGVMAQDFYKAFKIGADDEHITAVDTAGVTMLAIQGLNEALNEKTSKLQAENDRLREQLKQQQAQLDALKKIVCQIKTDAAVCPR